MSLRRITAVAAAVGAVVGSYVAIRRGKAHALDTRVREQVAGWHHPAADRVVAVATDLGSVYGLAGIATVVALSGRLRLGRDIALAGVAAWSAAQSMKPLLVRSRPYERGTAMRLVSPPAGSSWPSGHVAVTAAVASTVSPHLPVGARCVLWSTVAAVGVSRVHVGVHHASDVVAGWGIGVLSAVPQRRRR